MNKNKFDIRQKLQNFEPSVRKIKRKQIVDFLNIKQTRFSTIINFNYDVKFDFTFTQVIFISQVLECDLLDIYNTKVIQDYKKLANNNLVNKLL